MSDNGWWINRDGHVLQTRITRGHKATIAKVSFNTSDLSLEVTGEALVHPDDDRDEEIGDQLALGRALSALGRRLERRAEGLTKHHDDIKKMKANA